MFCMSHRMYGFTETFRNASSFYEMSLSPVATIEVLIINIYIRRRDSIKLYREKFLLRQFFALYKKALSLTMSLFRSSDLLRYQRHNY